MLNFPSICSGDWNICAEYDLEADTLTGALTLTRTRTLAVRCLITSPVYHLWKRKSLSECPAFENLLDFRPNQFQNIPFTYKHIPFTYKRSNTMKGFANETACFNRVLICHFLYEALNWAKVSLYCHKNSFVMYRVFCFFVIVNAPVRGSRPRKS